MKDDEHRDFKHHSWPTPTAMTDHHSLPHAPLYHKQPTPLYPHEHSKLRRFSQRFSASSSSYASYSSALAAAAASASAAHQHRPSQYQQQHLHRHQQQHHHYQHFQQQQSSEDPSDSSTRRHCHSQQDGPVAVLGSETTAGTSTVQQQRHSTASTKGVQDGLSPVTCALSDSAPPSPLSSPLAIRMPTSSSYSCPSLSAAFPPLSPSSLTTMDPAQSTMSLALSLSTSSSSLSCSSSSSSSTSSASTAMALCSPVMTVVSTLSQDSSPDSTASSRCSSRTSSTSPPPGRSRKASLVLLQQNSHPSQHLHRQKQQREPKSGSQAESGPWSSTPKTATAESSAVMGEGFCTSYLSSRSSSLSSASSLPSSELKKNRRYHGHGHTPTASISTTRSSMSSESSRSSNSSSRQHHRLSTATTASSLSHSSRSSSSSLIRKKTDRSSGVISSPQQQNQLARTSHSHQQQYQRQQQQHQRRLHRHAQHSSLQQAIISPQAIAQKSTKYICFLFWPLLPLLILAIGGQTSARFESPEKNGPSPSFAARLRHHTDFVGHVRLRKQPPSQIEVYQSQHQEHHLMADPVLPAIGPLENWLFLGQPTSGSGQSDSIYSPLLTTGSMPPPYTTAFDLLSHPRSPRQQQQRSQLVCYTQEKPPQPQAPMPEEVERTEEAVAVTHSLEQQGYERLLSELHQPWDRESCGCAISGSRLLSMLSWDMVKPGYSWKKRRSLIVSCRDGSSSPGRQQGDLADEEDVESTNAVSASNLLTAWVDMVDQVLGSIYEVSRWKSRAEMSSTLTTEDATSAAAQSSRKRSRSQTSNASLSVGEGGGAAASSKVQQERQMLGQYLFRIAFVLGLVLLCMAIHETFFAKVEMPSYTRA